MDYEDAVDFLLSIVYYLGYFINFAATSNIN
jgi:hypothetical protein